MKALILAGGFGTRLAEETALRPKPMVEIGGYPMLWHIMEHYSRHGIKEFVVCLGYKANYVKKFFIDYSTTLSDFTINLQTNEMFIHSRRSEDWQVTFIDTGLETMTGGSIKRALREANVEDTFCLTYGDGLSNVDIGKSIIFHKQHEKLATVTAVTPPGRFGVLDITENNAVIGFREKFASDVYRINGGFFVLEPQVGEYIEGDRSVWEKEPLNKLATEDQLKAWVHDGFWHPMDTLRDKNILQEMWDTGNPPWKK